MDGCSAMAIDYIDHKLNLTTSSQRYDEDEEGYEFSFACAEAATSPISADDLFHNGQIRSISPLFGNDTIQGAANFVERTNPPEASDCTRPETDLETPVPRSCRRSYSTGFSKLRRFRDMLLRSQSDGKETFAFLTRNSETTSSSSKKKAKSEIWKQEENCRPGNGRKGCTAPETKTTPSKGKTTPLPSSYAMQYGKNGEKGREKRRSYLPYRQDLVGFFTTANALSRNIHGP